jgi:hypothetical protein
MREEKRAAARNQRSAQFEFNMKEILAKIFNTR